MRMQTAERREDFSEKAPAAHPAPTEAGRADPSSALAASEQRFHDFAELVSDWIWETGPSLRFTYLSGRFEEITGLAPAAVLDRTLLDVAKADLRDPHWQRQLEDFLAQRPFKNFRFSSTRLSGEMRHFQVSGKPYFDAQGRFLGMTGMRNAVLASTQGSAPPVRLVRAETIRAFLDVHNVPAAPAQTGDAKDSVVRIICVRK